MLKTSPKIRPNQPRFEHLRQEYPEFVYEKFSIAEDAEKIYLRFFFNLDSRISFCHEINLLKKSIPNSISIKKSQMENLVFHIGMIELIRYWQLTCAPTIRIKAGALNSTQVCWWKTLYYQGLQEFLYLNGIETTAQEFVVIQVEGDLTFDPFQVPEAKNNLILIGGGKDSIVTLDMLSKTHDNNLCFVFNPRPVRLNCAAVAGYSSDRIFEIMRISDPQMVQMRHSEYLTGHRPVSASLAFIALWVAGMVGIKYIIVSNESSANESNISNSDINHQYSKSFAFEKSFSNYVQQYITPDIHYFSLLRPLNELQIAQQFSTVNPDYFKVFCSCNLAGSGKTKQWCNACAKCLFVYLILFPFVDESDLLAIFGKNLFAQENLMPIFKQLIGMDPIKPFECVGTREEVNAALTLGLNKWHQANPGLSISKCPLLAFYENNCQHLMMEDHQINALLKEYNPEHLVPAPFQNIVMQIYK